MATLKDIIDTLRGNPIELSINIGNDEPIIDRIFARADAVKWYDCIVQNIYGSENDYNEPCLYIELKKPQTKTFNPIKVKDSEYQISKVCPCYTGGGIYVYLGELVDGRGFVAWDLAIGETGEIAITKEFQYDYFDDFYELESNVIYEFDDTTEKAFNFWNTMIDWIIENEPEDEFCNYQMDDIERRKAGKVG